MVEITCREDTLCAAKKNAAESKLMEDAILACPSALLLRLLEAMGTSTSLEDLVVVASLCGRESTDRLRALWLRIACVPYVPEQFPLRFFTALVAIIETRKSEMRAKKKRARCPMDLLDFQMRVVA